MFIKLVFFIFLCQTLRSSSQILNLTYNGFHSPTDISLRGIATVTPNGLLKLTNTTVQKTGHAFYTEPIRFKDSPNSTVSSFSTSFVFAIHSQIPTLSGHGIAFVVAPTPGLPSSLPSQYIGLFNVSNNGNATNHVFAVEFDTIQSSEFGDPNDNHVGIDINGLRSVKFSTAGYWNEKDEFRNLSLISRKLMQVWIDYDKSSNRIDVTMAPFDSDKPRKPLVSYVRDLSPVLLQDMYVGFASATGSVISEHFVAGWSFSVNGEAPMLTLSKLPKLPRFDPKRVSDFYKIGMPLISLFLIFSVIFLALYMVRRKKKFEEELEDWETEFGKNRFRFKELYHATKGFKEKGLLGSGGFGRVYRGILTTTKLEVAVKRVSHDSKQGMKEFVAEIVSIGRMSHRNLVPLLGYCRRRGELLLVYDYMPNGSLDKYLYNFSRMKNEDKNLHSANFWEARSSSGSWLWLKLLKLRPLARLFIQCRVGSGSSCSFWHDNWTGLGPLSLLFDRQVFSLTGISQDATVQEAIARGNWRLSSRSRNPIITFLRSILPDAASVLQPSVPDIFLWRYPDDDPSQQTSPLFSASRTFASLFPAPTEVPWHRAIWFSGRIPKHSFITWLATLDRLATKDRIHRFSPAISTTCLLCYTHVETRDHLFFSCSYSLSLLCTVLQVVPTHCDLLSLLQWLPQSSPHKYLRIIAHLLLQASVYSLWRERNSRLHTNASRPLTQLVRDIGITVKAKLIALTPPYRHTSPSLLESWFGHQAHDHRFLLSS